MNALQMQLSPAFTAEDFRKTLDPVENARVAKAIYDRRGSSWRWHFGQMGVAFDAIIWDWPSRG